MVDYDDEFSWFLQGPVNLCVAQGDSCLCLVAVHDMHKNTAVIFYNSKTTEGWYPKFLKKLAITCL